MRFSTRSAKWRRTAVASASTVVGAVWFAPAGSLAHELKASAALTSADAALVAKQRMGIPLKEIKRGNAYAPAVGMPEGASVKLAGADLRFRLARLNPLVRRSVGLGSSEVGAIAAPVMAMQVSATSSVTFIKVMGDANGAMLAWQLKL